MFDTYKPSGRIGMLTWPLLLLGLIVVVAAAFAYQIGLRFIPLIYINLLLALGMGMLIGKVGAMVVQQGKVRNITVAAIIALSLILFAIVAKFGFQYLGERQNLPEIVRQSGELPPNLDTAILDNLIEEIVKSYTFVEHIKDRVDTGWNLGRMGRNGAPINGFFVYLVWIIEAGIFVYCAVMPTIRAAREPFSEKLDAWASEVEVLMTLPISDQSMVTQIQSAQTVVDLLKLPIPKTDQATEFGVYRVNSIPGQELEDAYLSVDVMDFRPNKDGEQVPHFKPLVKMAILSSEQRKILIDNASLLKEAMDDYRASLEEEAAAASADETDGG